MESPKKEPNGIGGWLIVPALGLIITPFRIGLQFYLDLLPPLTPERWSAVTHPDSADYHPLWGPLIAFEVIAAAAFFIFTLWLLWLFFTKSKRVPRLVIIWLALLPAIQVAGYLLAAQIPAITAQPFGPEEAKEIVLSIINAVIWIPYFIRSRRVKNTFIEPLS